MLANALFCAALLALIATTFLDAGLAMTRAAVRRSAATYVAAGYQIATKTLEHALAAQMQSGGLPDPLPSISPAPAQCADPACRYLLSETIVFTTLAAGSPSPGASCDPAQTNCAPNEQANPFVDEGRIAARIGVTVSDANQNVLIERGGAIALRTLRAPPYVVVAGFRDDTLDDVVAAAAPGDDGGLAPATPNPCGSPPSGTSDDTAIRVAYQNAQSGACSDGSSWRARSYSQQQAEPAGWSP